MKRTIRPDYRAMRSEDPEKVGRAVIGCVFGLLLYPALAVALIWALNTLIGLGIAYTAWNIVAAIVLVVALGS